jgi:hypothetical protein
VGLDEEKKTEGWGSMAIIAEEYGEMIFSGSSTEATGASRSRAGEGGGSAGMRWEEMIRRFLRARIPRANPCNMFPRYRNLEAIEKTTWNIVNGRLRCESAKVRKCTSISDEERMRGVARRIIYFPLCRRPPVGQSAQQALNGCWNANPA